MLDKVSNKEIAAAVDELIICLGVKEENGSKDLVALLRKGDTQACVQEIATRLGLPVRINLLIVPKNYRPGSPSRFRSSALVPTDCAGRGIGGIVAQVSIPQHLPLFGTSGLQDYPIRVCVSENCHTHPYSFVAIMAHELSHVLLASLWSPYSDCELHVDLVPIILGFRDAARKGRKTIESTTKGNTRTRRVTTYGYLADAQFEFAQKYVTGILDRRVHDNWRLLGLVGQVRAKRRKVTQRLATFREYFKHLDIHPREKMRKEHAERLVELHVHDYSLQWESRIRAVGKSIEVVEAAARSQNHYFRSATNSTNARMCEIEAASKELDDVAEAVAKDQRIMRKYVGITYRLRRMFRRRS